MDDVREEELYCSWQYMCSKEGSVLEVGEECWSSLSTELILKSFHSCGFSVNVDCSEDVEIYCLKAGEVAA